MIPSRHKHTLIVWAYLIGAFVLVLAVGIWSGGYGPRYWD